MSAVLFLIIAIFFAFAILGQSFNPNPKEGPAKQLDSKGVLNLDTFTYKKLIPSDKYTFLILVYSKGSVGDYGTDSMRSDFYTFAKKAQAEGESDNIIFAQIVVNGADNIKLAQKLGAKKDLRHPELFLIQSGKKTAIPYPSNKPFRLYELVAFTSEHSDFYLKQAGRTKFLNSLRSSILAANSKSEREELLASARRELSNIAGLEKVDAEYHVGVLEKFVEHGYSAIEEEAANLKGIIAKSNGGEKRLHELRFDVVEELQRKFSTREL